jgi:hypothetical protein
VCHLDAVIFSFDLKPEERRLRSFKCALGLLQPEARLANGVQYRFNVEEVLLVIFGVDQYIVNEHDSIVVVDVLPQKVND